MTKKYIKENQTEQEILAALEELQITRYNILPDNSVDVHENVYIFEYHLTAQGKLKLHFNEVVGVFECSDSHLTSFEGFPRKVSRNLRCRRLTHVKSLEGCSSEVGRDVILEGTRITSLVGVSDIFKKINGQFQCDFEYVTEGGIGLLNIEGLKQLYSTKGKLPPAFEIISKYLGNPNGMFDCQSELFDAGLDAFAQL